METGIATVIPPEIRRPLDPAKVLFVGVGATAVGWYRCYLPAMHMGADWVGLLGEPPRMAFLTGLVKRQTAMANFNDYDIVVLQQPRGTGWLNLIKQLQGAGKKVFFEVDDYLHAIRKQEDHDFREHFDKKALARLEMNMRVVDGLICSTEYIARRYRSFNKRVFVCENGVDLGRYNMTRPPRQMVNIGWAGATGHAKNVQPWLEQVAAVMGAREDTCFVSIGMNFAQAFHEHFPAHRAIGIPFTLVDIYPSAMTMFDIALGPAGKTNFFRGKSDLRWLEAGALGIPIIADPTVYPKIEHGVNGFHASTPAEMRELLMQLVDDPDLRLQVGEAARAYVRNNRDMRIAVRQWERVFQEVLNDD